MFSITAHSEDFDTTQSKQATNTETEVSRPNTVERHYWVGLDAEVYHAYFSGNQSLFTRTVQVRPKVHVNYFLEKIPLSLGGEFSSYSEPGLVAVSRAELLGRIGYWWNHQQLGLILSAGYATTSIDRFSSDISSQVGLSAHYRIPIQMLEMDLSLGWSFQDRVTLFGDSGIPQTNDPFANALCSVFSLGLSSGCGNTSTQATVPASNILYLGIGIGI